MLNCDVSLDPAFRVAPVDPRLFGSFVEHMGRCVYGGIFDPDHAETDTDGYRLDVLKLVRELGVTMVRYPGGNFVSGYRWEDGVGPVEQRPRRLDLAWRSLESNRFGLGEFMTWARRAETEPMMVVNLGSRGIEEACNLLEYANHPGGTYWSDLRRSHGASDPYGIKLWCLGNEMDGPWQIGHRSADDYGKLALATAKAMRQIDPTIQLVACGSSNDRMPTFGQWEATVLEHTFECVDYISLHAYYEKVGEDRASFLASGWAMDRFIEGVTAAADYVAAKKRSRRKLMLSFDEWNIWYEGRFAGHTNLEWAAAPRLIEDEYTVEDAVVVGGLLISLLRHADRVSLACLAQLVNVIAPIRTEHDRPAWRQSIFYPFALTARHAHGEVLRVEPNTPTYETGQHGEVPVADVVATRSEAGEVTIFALNRSQTDEVLLRVDLRALPAMRLADHTLLGGQAEHLLDANTAEEPERVRPRPGNGAVADSTALTVALPSVSWTMLRLERM